ncbi:putative metal ABC transporter substrate-binding protein Hpf [Abditibacteriota bacterium]|nr:putative metal ABC transporter substrate-binding protein Hpf [Abditibacteriota bacterium]
MNIFKITRRAFVFSGVLALASLLTATARPANAAINVVTSLPELAAITREVGGDNVSVYSVARPNNDYHRYEALPSDVARISRAKLVVTTGMEFEMWMTSLINAAARPNLQPGGPGYVNTSEGVRRLEVPTQQISGASGDIHSDGNPHFYYDPVYAKFIARSVLRGLIRVDAAHGDAYRANYGRFNSQIDAHMATYKAELGPYAGEGVVTYHQNYAYFLRRFGLKQYGNVEPKPGIPPSARHVNELAQNMKRDHIRAIIVESIYPTRFPTLLAQQAGTKYVVAPYSVGSLGTTNYFNFMDKLVASFKSALSHN